MAIEASGSARPSYIVIGASSGGLAVLVDICKDLPADLPAAILVVSHVSRAVETSMLAQRLGGAGRCPVRANGRYLRARIEVAAGGDWRHIQGIDDVEASPAGLR